MSPKLTKVEAIMHISATFKNDSFLVNCEAKIIPSIVRKLTALDAEISVSNADGKVMPRQAVVSACLSGLAYGRKSLPHDDIQMSLLSAIGTYPTEDLTDLAGCVCKMVTEASKCRNAVCESDSAYENWSIHLVVKCD